MAATLARPQQTPWSRGVALTVPDNLETEVHSLTVPGGFIWLDEVDVTGNFAAEVRLYLNGVHEESKRFENANGQAVFSFGGAGRKLRVGDIVSVRVVHYHVGRTHDYEATIKLHR